MGGSHKSGGAKGIGTGVFPSNIPAMEQQQNSKDAFGNQIIGGVVPKSYKDYSTPPENTPVDSVRSVQNNIHNEIRDTDSDRGSQESGKTRDNKLDFTFSHFKQE